MRFVQETQLMFLLPQIPSSLSAPCFQFIQSLHPVQCRNIALTLIRHILHPLPPPFWVLAFQTQHTVQSICISNRCVCRTNPTSDALKQTKWARPRSRREIRSTSAAAVCQHRGKNSLRDYVSQEIQLTEQHIGNVWRGHPFYSKERFSLKPPN